MLLKIIPVFLGFLLLHGPSAHAAVSSWSLTSNHADPVCIETGLAAAYTSVDTWFAGLPPHGGGPGKRYGFGVTSSPCALGRWRDDAAFSNVPFVINERVEWFISYFQGRGRKSFTRWLERSGRYLPMINETLRREGLPTDLAYLAMIESGFNPTARSRSRAVGLWQFIMWTGRKNGLRSDWWIDERRDPVKATIAAARHLKDLYARFGSWYLAAAAYNAGEGRIAGAIRRHNTTDFWVLAKKRRPLKTETKNYVPKYLAARLIAKDPEKYGFFGLDFEEPLAYEGVVIERPTDLNVIAKAAGTTVGELKRLNPGLKRWFTPPEYPGFEMKLPVGTALRFAENMKLVPASDRLKFHVHRVKKGDTLSHIARRYGTGIKPIMYLNGLKSSRFIREGSKLMVPVRARKNPRVRTAAVSPARESVPTHGVYTVKRGDTLWAISIRFGLRLEDIKRLNRIEGTELIHPGQKLLIKTSAVDAGSSEEG